MGTPPDILSGVCRPPSRTAHPPLSPPGLCPGLGVREGVGGVSLAHPRGPETALHRSHLHYAPPPAPPTTGCSKAPQGLLAPPSGGVPGLCTRRWVRRAPPGRDSGDLVDPFMHAGTYPARHLATLRGSELPPGLQRRFARLDPGFTYASGQDSAPVHTFPGGVAGLICSKSKAQNRD